MSTGDGLRYVAPTAIDRACFIFVMAVDALLVSGITAFAHFHAFDLIGLVTVETGCWDTLIFSNHLVADTAFPKVWLIVRVMVTIFTGCTVLIRRKMSFVVEKEISRIRKFILYPKGLVRRLGGVCCVTDDTHNKQNSCKCIGQLKFFFLCHFR
jgi:hypothetical protein